MASINWYTASYKFFNCPVLATVTIGRGLTRMGSYTFANCSELTDFYCMAENVPSTTAQTFSNSYIEYATLHVPSASVEKYSNKASWSQFGTIKGCDDVVVVVEQCATPTINIVNNEVTFSCATEGVEFIYTTRFTDKSNRGTASVTLGGSYEVSVYAVKDGWKNSETATATIALSDIIGKVGDVNKDGTISIADVTKVVSIILGKE